MTRPRRSLRALGLGCAIGATACARGGVTQIELPPLGAARASIVAASDAEDSTPVAVAFDPASPAPRLPTLDDTSAEAGVFTVLTYAAPLEALRLAPGRMPLEPAGPDIGALPEPLDAYERTSEPDAAWAQKPGLAQTALRPSRVGLRRGCPALEVTWTPIEGVTGYVQAAAQLDANTTLVATDTTFLVRVDLTRGRAVSLGQQDQLVGALFVTTEGRIYAGTSSTAPIMEVLLDGGDVRFAPLPGLRLLRSEAMASLFGPPAGGPEPQAVLYGLARTGRLIHVTLDPPSTRSLDVLELIGEQSAGGEFIWVGPRRYVGYSNRAVGRVFTIVNDVVSSRQVTLGAFGALIAHPVLGALFFDGLVPRALAPGEVDLRELAPLPSALVSVEAAAATPWGFIASGVAGEVSAYLLDDDAACAPILLAPARITRLVALPDGDLLAFTSDAPAAGWPTSWGRLKARFR